MVEEFIFYFGKENAFSHWYACRFTISKIEFCCVGQYLMYRKAMLFGDVEIAKRILNSTDPSRHRYLGKRVPRFEKTRWHEHCRSYAYEGEYAKYSQDPLLKELLLHTAGKGLAEASPYDRIWGIGLSMSNPRINDRKNWRGRNYAGEVLESVRRDLLRKRTRRVNIR